MRDLQHRPDRAEVYLRHQPAVRGDDGIVYIIDGALAVEILKSDDFRVHDLVSDSRKLARATGLDLSESHKVFDLLAPVRHGTEHRKARIGLAQRMADLSEPLLDAASSILDEVISDRFVPGGEVDLSGDLFFRIYRKNAEVISGLTDIDIAWASWVVSVTFKHTSLRTRVKINEDLSRRMAALSERGDDAIMTLALLILGSEAFTGAFILSLWETIERQPERALNEIAWPDHFPQTAAPMIERLALRDYQAGPVAIKAGDLLRVCLGASVAYGPLATENVMFGRGRHSCIGRRYSEALWHMVIEKLSCRAVRPELVDLQIRTPDDFMRFPQCARVRFHDN